ncbi:hypothetical protein Back11_11470 [Paenibacillus baekrokdamisoli]|uniref:Uncharacterized protein n=1 Tax=Paenibacillus baekrokdamisoli TaxID=1712516 RepID=A0A3G9INJ0_9BACL|nr:hypothetical protein [Paenibacillus baekrokdamisoli]MBB3070448.1 hypothetical protein [Paenibacillus baekrokdamisoli]BBH19802.1 hypothetical protein Back11_11470 [Paenibacillus baekrokdamisoli]
MSKTLSKAEIVSKFAKQFASSGNTGRPVLEGIHYGTDGTAFVTNAHFGLRVSNVHSFQQSVTLHAKSGQPIEGIYPDFSKVFPTDFHEEIEILQAGVPDALLAAQCIALVASKLSKKAPIAGMEIIDGEINLTIENKPNGMEMTAKLGEAPVRSRSLRMFNAEYFLTALSVFDAANSSVTIKLRGPLDPIVLSNNNGIDILILPFRVAA